MVKKKKYNYLYKITNLINGMFYYGIHTTNYLNDNYMGSGTRIKEAYDEYGIENFKKEILEFFETRELAALREREIVNEELIKDPNCYNVILGGGNFTTTGTATMRDKYGNVMQVSVDDYRIKTGELFGATKNQKKGQVKVKFPDGKIHFIPTSDERYQKKELIAFNVGKVLVCNSKGDCFTVSQYDERLKTGELKYVWTGKKHKKESLVKQKETLKKIGHQQGKKNSQYGTCWVMKNDVNKKIPKSKIELYLKDGWILGRKMPIKK